MKKRNAQRIRRNMMVAYLLVLLVPSITIGYFTYRDAAATIERQIMEDAASSVITADKIIDQTIGAKLHDLGYFIGEMNSASTNQEQANGGTQIRDRLRQYHNLHPETSNIYVGTATGSFISGSNNQVADDYDPRERDWYQQAMNSPGQPIVTAPYTSASSSETVVTVAQTLEDGEGVMGINLNMDQIRDLVQVQVGREGYTTVVDQTHKFLFHPEYPAGTDAESNGDTEWVARLFEQADGQFSFQHPDSGHWQINYITNEWTGWKIVGVMSNDEVTGAVADIRSTMIWLLAGSLIIGLALAAWNIRSVIEPVRKLREATEIISGGNLAYRLTGFKRNEIGELADNFQQMVDNLRDMIHGVKDMTENVSASSEQLSASAEENTRAIELVTSSVQEVAVGSERQVQAVADGLQRMNEVNGQADTIASTLEEVHYNMQSTAKLAEQGNLAVITTADTMQGIDTVVKDLGGVIEQLTLRTEEISGIIGDIVDISQQTSLLALNASIEAARAGEQGRGFAVVAAEVQKLAKKSEGSAQQITSLIGSVLEEVKRTNEAMRSAEEKVSEGVGAVDVTGRSFSRIKKSVESVTASVAGTTEIAHALASHAAVTKQAVESIREISEQALSNTQSISAASEEQLASMEEVAASASDLSRLSEELQQLVERFKL
ncbi:methyl-accepting chemotaxis protein [Paenibacillus campinasensis]|uniref:HAMP domain-containing protein n=2 Tax=Paenibacillus campinasensis TaxID=66347 RepID=A0A268EVZ6_9BACL|nr:methyl-accepting chemotaxis protein [Paenibacillus campinasensis]PAD77290.1 hypothetical protein CHH67_09780 [Paenibacillus campinasensis]